MKKRPTQQSQTSYTCNEYREDMIILALRLRLQKENLTEEEKTSIEEEIRRLEETAGF